MRGLNSINEAWPKKVPIDPDEYERNVKNPPVESDTDDEEIDIAEKKRDIEPEEEDADSTTFRRLNNLELDYLADLGGTQAASRQVPSLTFSRRNHAPLARRGTQVGARVGEEPLQTHYRSAIQGATHAEGPR